MRIDEERCDDCEKWYPLNPPHRHMNYGEPGRALDALVANKVMRMLFSETGCPKYSTDISEAFKVASESKFSWMIKREYTSRGYEYIYYSESKGVPKRGVRSTSLAYAICIGLLKEQEN